MSEEIKKGLLGIVVDETTISHVVPELSALTYRGYTVQEQQLPQVCQIYMEQSLEL